MSGQGIVNHASPLSLNKFSFTGDLQLHQREILPPYAIRNAYSSMPVDFASLKSPFNWQDIIEANYARNGEQKTPPAKTGVYFSFEPNFP
jgi:hypothetical protein